jgi:hypothetical protein
MELVDEVLWHLIRWSHVERRKLLLECLHVINFFFPVIKNQVDEANEILCAGTCSERTGRFRPLPPSISDTT